MRIQTILIQFGLILKVSKNLPWVVNSDADNEINNMLAYLNVNSQISIDKAVGVLVQHKIHNYGQQSLFLWNAGSSKYFKENWKSKEFLLGGFVHLGWRKSSWNQKKGYSRILVLLYFCWH